jgi:hypothetical protein
MGTIQPGSLIIFDNFAAKGQQAEHGDRVRKAAEDEGFKGPIVEEAKPEKINLNENLYTPHMRKDEFKKAMQQDMAWLQLKTLRNATNELKKLESQGVNHSAVNFSAGMSKASVVDQYFQKMSLGWDDRGAEAKDGKTKDQIIKDSKAMYDNFARANGTTVEELNKAMDKNPTATEQWIKDRLAAAVEAPAKAPKVLEARAEYDKAVHSFEKNHNSVVVAAENSGDLQVTNRPADFYDNVLSSKETTTVGAVDSQNSQVESYSNPSKNVSIYARGQSPHWAKPGTSYAAPRVAAAMAKAHQLNQQMESDEVEREVQKKLTTQVPHSQARSLDAAKTGAYFAQN